MLHLILQHKSLTFRQPTSSRATLWIFEPPCVALYYRSGSAGNIRHRPLWILILIENLSAEIYQFQALLPL